MLGRRKMTRRMFLSRSGGMLVGAGLLQRASAAGQADRPKPLLLAVRDSHLSVTGEPDSWAAMKKLGVEAVEVLVERDFSCPNLFPKDKQYSLVSDDAIAQLAKDLKSHNLKISAFCLMNRLEENPDEEVSWTVAVARAAAKLGVKAIRIDIVPRRLQGDDFLRFSIETCKRILKESEKTGMRFGIENHGSTTNRVEFLEKLFDGVGSERLGLTLDVANFYWFGYPLNELYGIYRKFANRVFHTHCKSIRYPEDVRDKQRTPGWEYGKYNCPIYEGDIDFRRVLNILRQAGYDNDLCVENESLPKFPEDKRAEVLKKEVEFLRGLLH